MTRLTITGVSGDIIQVADDGDMLDAEFDPQNYVVGDLLAFSDGTVISVRFSASGVWRITPVATGTAAMAIVPAPEGDEQNYSDRVTLDGDIRWIVHGVEHKLRPSGATQAAV